MRIINLLKIAAEAESLHVRAMLARHGRGAAFGAVAGLFALGVLVLAEITGWIVLRGYQTALWSTLILLGVNLVLAAAFALLALWSKPGRAEREAQDVRQQALDAVRANFTLAAAVAIIRTLLRFRGSDASNPCPPLSQLR